MPYSNLPDDPEIQSKMESCVKQVMEKDGKTKESAIAICYKSVMGEAEPPARYKKIGDAHKSILSIRPRVNLAQANEIALLVEGLADDDDEAQPAWPIAINQWKKQNMVRGGAWIRRDAKKGVTMAKLTEVKPAGDTLAVSAAEAETVTMPPLNEITFATSFADLRAQQEAYTAAETATGLVNQFQGLAMNIVNLPGEGKGAKLRALSDEFISLIKDALGEIEAEPEPEAEQPEPQPAEQMEAHESGARMRGEMLARLADARNVLDEIHAWGSYAEAQAKQAEAEPPAAPDAAPIVPQEAAPDMQAAQVEIFAESIDGASITMVAEAEVAPDGGRRAPIKLDVVLIRPGWGNRRDGHYYPADMLRRDAAVFEGAKMYATDHRQGEKSVRTEVSRVARIKGFTDDGAPIAEVVVFEPSFAEMVRNRADAGLLNTLECSILAWATAKEGTVDGAKGKIVEAITSAQSVDWVTRAGAGGHAERIAEADIKDDDIPEDKREAMAECVKVEMESGKGEAEAREFCYAKFVKSESKDESVTNKDAEPAETAEVAQPAPPAHPVVLSEAARDAVIDKTPLPGVAKDWLKESAYSDEAELSEAIKRAIERVKKLTRSGQPFAQGLEAAPANVSLEEVEKQKTARFNETMRRYGLKEV